MKKNYSTLIKSFKKNKAITLCTLAFMATLNSNAQTWTGTTDTDFATATNWDTGVAPAAGVPITITAATNNPVIATTTTAVCTTLGINVGGILTIKGTLTPSAASYTGGTIIIDGGTLNVRSNMNLGVTNNPSTVTLNSGTLNARNAFIVGEKGNCDLNITGGTASVDQNNGGAIIIGGYYAVGIVNLNGGTLKARASLIGTAALAIQEQPTRSGTGHLKIDGGTLELGGDQKSFVEGYVSDGKIIPGAGKKIVITVIPAVLADPAATPPILATAARTLVTATVNLGIDTKTPENNFSVYPNPSNGVINIENKNNDAGNLNISVYNLAGQQIVKSVLENNNSGTYSLDATNTLSSGTYIINIKTDSSSHNSKIVIK